MQGPGGRGGQRIESLATVPLAPPPCDQDGYPHNETVAIYPDHTACAPCPSPPLPVGRWPTPY
jgi:hypothetical protein